jgi:signal transduction histidine kinase
MICASDAVNLDTPLFSDDDNDGLTARLDDRPWKVLVVDDEEDVISITRLVFSSFRYEDKPIKLLTASSAGEARGVLKSNRDIAMAFVDVVMETDSAGLDLVQYIRETLGNQEIQLVLRTGQPGFAPEMKVILEYGINDYRTKTELDNVKLISCMVAALRNYKNITTAKEAIHQETVAHEVHKSRSLFFAQMSHDLRTPLNSILGFCQLLGLSNLDTEQAEHVTLIQQSGAHLLALVNDILDLSKGEAGKIQLESVRFSLSALVNDTAKFLQPQVAETVRFECDVDISVPGHVLGDPVRVRQILYNLLSNALKFTAHGLVKLVVRSVACDADTYRVQFSVQDTGIGIPEDKLSGLFSVYEQADASVNRAYGGTGLGLSICKQLAELMGGNIQVSSVEGKGSTFAVTIELGIIDHEKTAPMVRHEHARVLVVDDDRVSGMVVKRMLEHRGFHVSCAESGEQAFECALLMEYDMILMDCQMPGMGGVEACKRIRGLKGYDDVPIVALSGSEADDVQACFSAGMNDFVRKPASVEALTDMVSKWLGFRAMMK